jgi:PST family polysaccharide transporter
MRRQPPTVFRETETQMTHLKILALQGAFWSSVEGWGRQLVSLLLFVVVARLLTPVDMGLFAMIVIVLAAVQMIIDEGLNEVLVQRHDVDALHLDSAFWMNLVGTGLICGATALGAPWIAQLFGEPRIAPMIQLASAAPLVVGLVGVHHALMRRQLRYRVLAVRSVIGVVAGGLVGIVLAWRGHGAWALVAQQVADRLVGGAILWLSAHWTPRLRFSLAHARELMPYSLFLTATRVVNFSSKQVDRYLVALLMGPAALGLYTLAFRVNDTVGFLVVQGLANISMSTFSRLQHQLERMRTALYAAAELSSMLAMPIFLGVAAVAPHLVVVLFGGKWAGSGPVLAIIALLGIPGLVSNFAGAIMRAMGTTRLLLGVLTLSAVVNILVVAATVRFGLLVVASALVLRNLCFVPLYLLVMNRLVGASPVAYLGCCLPAVMAGLAMAGAVRGLDSLALQGMAPASALVIEILFGMAVYPLLLWVLAPASVSRALAVWRDYRSHRTAPLEAETAA